MNKAMRFQNKKQASRTKIEKHEEKNKETARTLAVNASYFGRN